MRARHLFGYVLVAALLAACTTAKPVPVTAPPPAAPVAHAVDLRALNEQTFAEIQRQNWAEAIRLGEQAVALAPSDPPARFNLGLALYRAEKYPDARVHLEKAYALNQAQVEPGWFLALTLEKLGDQAGAAAILAELGKRFPQDQDVAQALTRLRGSAPVIWTAPAGGSIADFFGDSMAVDFGDGKPITVVDATGKTLWSYTLPGAVVKLLPEEGQGRRVLAVVQGKRLVLIDPDRRVARAVTGVAFGPDPSGKGGWFHFRGDLLYAGSDIWMSDHYSATHWQGYRLTMQGDQFVAQRLGEGLSGGQHVELGPDGRTARTPNPIGNGEIYSDGKKIAAPWQPGSLTPKGDAIFAFTAGRLRVTSLTGALLYETASPEPYRMVTPVPRVDDFWCVLTGTGEGYAVLLRDHVIARSDEGRVLWVTGRALIVRVGESVRVVDLSGKVLTTYAEHDGRVTADGNWFYEGSETELRAYRLPQ